MRFALLPIIALAAPNAVAAQPERSPVTLEPTSNWVLDYGENRCRIVREFAPRGDRERTILYFEQNAPDGNFNWLVAGGAVPNRSKVTVRFGPVHESREIAGRKIIFAGFDNAISGVGFSGSNISVTDALDEASAERLRAVQDLAKHLPQSPTEKNAIVRNRTSQPERPQMGAIKWLDIEPGTGRAVHIPLEEMAKIETAMKTCMDDLLTSWGVDPELQAKVVQPPVFANALQVARRIQDHYPEKALQRGDTAQIQLRVMIEASGEPSKCVRTDITKAENFDNSPCLEIMRNGKFEPARDAEGRPLRSYFLQNIRYLVQ